MHITDNAWMSNQEGGKHSVRSAWLKGRGMGVEEGGECGQGM